MDFKKIGVSVFRIFLPLVVGGIVGFIMSSFIDYNVLNKPPLSPPGWVFPVAWSIIYLLMGISYYLFRKNVDYNINRERLVYYLQLGVNALWSIFFFVFKWRLFSIFWILLLMVLVVYLFNLFFRKFKTSAYLLIPYIIWLLFATYLNIGVYVLN